MLAETNAGTWAESDIAAVKEGKKIRRDKGEAPGPLPVAVIAEIEHNRFKAPGFSGGSNAKSKVAVFGSSDFIRDQLFNMSGNRDFFMNTLAFMAEEEDTIAIRPREKSFEPLFMSKTQGRMIFLIPVVFMPLLVLAVGIMVFIRRKMS